MEDGTRGGGGGTRLGVGRGTWLGDEWGGRGCNPWNEKWVLAIVKG